MEVEIQEMNRSLAEGVAQLTAAAAQLDRAAAAIEVRFAALSGTVSDEVSGAVSGTVSGEVPRVVAAIEGEPSGRLAELEVKLRAAEQQIAELRAQSATAAVSPGRKTLPTAAAHLLAKHGAFPINGEQGGDGALDAALTGLSLEQRIAVKSQLMRAGLLG